MSEEFDEKSPLIRKGDESITSSSDGYSVSTASVVTSTTDRYEVGASDVTLEKKIPHEEKVHFTPDTELEGWMASGFFGGSEIRYMRPRDYDHKGRKLISMYQFGRHVFKHHRGIFSGWKHVKVKKGYSVDSEYYDNEWPEST
ncbi:uncharacterized protein L201_003528 [Kwoniella dendrophila CBS 6074]|uniref:Uncharacterized protein n=1 Tax=Kwoniella dendrophila CBS 6074 TaxID=1295534 RepID=A0AAX4JT91_9TREE